MQELCSIDTDTLPLIQPLGPLDSSRDITEELPMLCAEAQHRVYYPWFDSEAVTASLAGRRNERHWIASKSDVDLPIVQRAAACVTGGVQ